MDLDVIFLITVFLSSFISGVAGMGGGILLLTIMLPMFPLQVVIPLHGVIQLTSNTSRVLISFRDIDVKVFTLFTLGALIGSLLVLPFDMEFHSNSIKMLLVVTILLFTWLPLNNIVLRFKGKFFIIGVISSFLSNFIGATGPLSAPFFLHSHLKKSHFVVTKAACQLPIHLFKVIIYVVSGFVLKDWIFHIITAMPLVITGNIMGKCVTQKIDGDNYKVIVKFIITLITVRMLIKIISG